MGLNQKWGASHSQYGQGLSLCQKTSQVGGLIDPRMHYQRQDEPSFKKIKINAKKIHDEQIIKNVNKDRLLFVCFMTLHDCARGTVVSNEPEVAR